MGLSSIEGAHHTRLGVIRTYHLARNLWETLGGGIGNIPHIYI